MALRLIDLPQVRQLEEYTNCVDFVVDKINKEKGVLAIYQFGNVTTPGISDIDMLVVFSDDVRCDLDPFESFPPHFNGLFTHGIDAMSESFFRLTDHFALWQNMILMSGTQLMTVPPLMNKSDLQLLKTQTALEYLVTNYIDLIMQWTYGIFKLRAFLQHAKGLIYDLELLDIQEGVLHDKVIELRSWIKNWHESPPSAEAMIGWLKKFKMVFSDSFQKIFSDKKLFVPPMEKRHYKLHAQRIQLAEYIFIRRKKIL
jgi:hypothetical protein